jgi:cellulose synthase (UDP-forming)
MSKELHDEIIKVATPLRSEVKTIRVLICCGIFSMIIFINWFVDPDHVGYSPIFWLLTFALTFKLVKMIHEWYHYWSPSVPVMPRSDRKWKVDVLTTACPGEPREMIIRTLRAMVDIKYPHTNYLCDEGDDPILKDICNNLGVVHVTRVEKINAKAGNINNALKQATGEIAVVLDPDHIPIPEFLDRVLPYFEDEEIGFVQCVQGYYNQEESFIARGAAEQTYHFYGPMMMCMNTYGTVQAIGANCTFRRSALDSIGGHAAGLSEDMHTAMQLHAKGWKSIYVPEMLTKGLVPATLSSYYKQQLKWSRGTFDLLFHSFPKLYKNFTWRQKIHYLTIPMYFLFGLINLIDIVVPVLALGLAEVPWEVDLGRFAAFFIPLCALSLCIRLYAQRWLLEKHERGFHFAGGVLRMATWWIFLIGFIYTIFNIKVPYIPTPKEDEHQNYMRLSVPNLLVFLICGLFVWYGLSIDWTPYSIAMASYSVMSISMLGLTIFLSQQKFIVQANHFCSRIPGYISVTHFVDVIISGSQQLVYSVLKQGSVVLILAFSLVFFSYNTIDEVDLDGSELTEKECGGFYLGTEFNAIDSATPGNNLYNLVSFTQVWNDTTQFFPQNEIKKIHGYGALPYMTWEPAQDLYEDICKGKYDGYLKECASAFRTFKEPIFVSLSQKNEISPMTFVKDWQYLYTFFNNLGISNITWVWCPSNAVNEEAYPGEKFVDWIGVSCLNYAANRSSKEWCPFSLMYEPFRNAYGKFKKPVMITNLGALKGETQTYWITTALDQIPEKYKEIKSVIIKNSKQKFNIVSNGDTSLYVSDFGFVDQAVTDSIVKRMQNGSFARRLVKPYKKELCSPGRTYRSSFIKGVPGNFNLVVNGAPYYIRGVAYNTAHDWRDGNMPLTRRQVIKDFENIKDMGANTIRRYGIGIYDRNVLNIAEEFNLKVLFGFWFDPKVDFYNDSARVAEYIKEVEEKVLAYKDHSSIIAWSLGNESWGLLKHAFAKPYLTKVRGAYIQLIEHLAQRIHQLDPSRPVFSCMEHEEYQLAGELVAFRDGAPSVDVIGVNSYYKEQITKLNHIAYQFDSLRPYLVSEFGPIGYWDPKYNRTNGRSIVEQTDSEKAEWYKEQWTNYVNGYKGYNIGGFAYCWHDRMEGSYTWFGLTDFKGRPKPAYYALRELWANKKVDDPQQFSIQGPTNFSPGTVCTFSAISNTAVNKNVSYEWRLLKDEYLDAVNTIEVQTDPSCVSVVIPKETSNYRLYVFITDMGDKRVTTASYPIKISKKM